MTNTLSHRKPILQSGNRVHQSRITAGLSVADLQPLGAVIPRFQTESYFAVDIGICDIPIGQGGRRLRQIAALMTSIVSKNIFERSALGAPLLILISLTIVV
ncbi:MAG: hypothetical protein LBT05_10180 [Planctomycetaceae bacterium]|jgi:hypothetical protein|nr:hypothetical protein [Planctomycetaceae bacterium]